jgi:tetratricopeptide (TPR) repeat protein
MRPSAFSRILAAALLASLMQLPQALRAADVDFEGELRSLAQAWDHANFDLASKDEKRVAFEALADRAGALAGQYPQRAEPLIWEGIILSSAAGAKGGLGALGLAKKSREHLLAALKISPGALNGSAYTSLGVLYYKVPGFPLGFGDREKARDYLDKALAANPEGIDPNYFYGELLFEAGQYEQALVYLYRAQHAPSRAGRPVADEGRRREIASLMARTRAKLG